MLGRDPVSAAPISAGRLPPPPTVLNGRYRFTVPARGGSFEVPARTQRFTVPARTIRFRSGGS